MNQSDVYMKQNIEIQKVSGGRGGFSLLEILLSLSLLLLLLSAAIFSFSTLDQNAKTFESVIQIEGLIKYVKANSANTGKNFRLDLSENVTNRIFWEADPLSNPGIYSSFSGGLLEFDFLDFINIELENTNAVQIFPNGELSDVNFLIVSKSDTNLQYKIIVDGKLGLIRHERIDAEDVENIRNNTDKN